MDHNQINNKIKHVVNKLVQSVFIRMVSCIVCIYIYILYRWLDEVREDGGIVGGEEWHGKVYDREEWKKLLRTARNHHILHMPME
jgi:uncharacterized protein involved in tolerance to divalent cations